MEIPPEISQAIQAIGIVEVFLKLLPYLKEKIEKWKREKEEIVKISDEEFGLLLNLYEIKQKIEEQSQTDERKYKELYDCASKFFSSFVLGYDKKQNSYVAIRKKSRIMNEYYSEMEAWKERGRESPLFVHMLRGEVELNVEFKEHWKKRWLEIMPELLDVARKLPPEYFSIINLSVQVEYLYLKGEHTKAEKIKDSIMRIYKEDGLRFSNLFQRGYIKALLKKYQDKPPIELHEKIDKFLREDSTHIYFIRMMLGENDIDIIMVRIKGAFKSLEKYIAIHSLGRASSIATSIVNEIKEIPQQYAVVKIDEPTNYIKKINGEEVRIRDSSWIWYTEEGKEIYSLLTFP